jgi:hypothetical protein
MSLGSMSLDSKSLGGKSLGGNVPGNRLSVAAHAVATSQPWLELP